MPQFYMIGIKSTKQQAQTADEIRQSIDVSKAEDQTLLLQMGFSEDIIQLTGANLPHTAEGPQSDGEKIIWYIDAILNGTQPVVIDKRFDALENDPNRSVSNVAFSKSYQSVFGEPLYDLQRRLGKSVGQYIASKIGFQGDVAALPEYLESRLQEKIAAM